MSPSAAKLHVDDVTMTFKMRRALSPRLCPSPFPCNGASSACIGRRGAAKSTIFNVIAGLLEPTGGRVLIDGIHVHRTHSACFSVLQKIFAAAMAHRARTTSYPGNGIQRAPLRAARERALPLLRRYGLLVLNTCILPRFPADCASARRCCARSSSTPISGRAFRRALCTGNHR